MLSHVHYIILFLITSPTTAIINTTVDIGHHLTTNMDKSQNERLNFLFFVAIFLRTGPFFTEKQLGYYYIKKL